MGPVEIAVAMLIKEMGTHLHETAKASGEEVARAVTYNAIGATAAALVAGIVPGAAAVIAVGVNVGFVWRMYYQINKALGISISKNVLKTLASGVLSNLVANLAGLVLAGVVSTAVSFFPVLNTVSSVLLAAATYATVYVAGLLYLKMLTRVARSGADISTMSSEELASVAQETFKENQEEFKAAFEQAKEEAKEKIKKGEITKDDKFDPEADMDDEP